MTAAEDLEYQVVINDEERYSIWPTYKEIPAGWQPVGFSGPKQTCLDHINEVWTDMRPASLRRSMEAEQTEDGAHRGDAS